MSDLGDLSRADIQRRVDDWLARLSALFGDITKWASDQGWKASDVGAVPMFEELMKRYDVPSASQPTLRLERADGSAYALFKPKGLWMIGANGRIDLYTSKGVYIIVDLAEKFSAPDWRIFRANNKQGGTPFAPALIAELA